MLVEEIPHETFPHVLIWYREIVILIHMGKIGTTSFAKRAFAGCPAWPLVTQPVATFDRGSLADVRRSSSQRRPAWTSPVFLIWGMTFDKLMQKDKKCWLDNWFSIVLWWKELILHILIHSFIIKRFVPLLCTKLLIYEVDSDCRLLVYFRTF